ncbi:phage putative head morphogenesis protein, SPP1 gp7 family [Gottschalkia purinilytica]|uniref:Phage putative head morphogenesis protein, SPP1 gp7 family n=1 Tax=Gottschalkia purinilytica TaxID=1503 RepID=A0A0L0W6S0_GOTPU|nr:minor capsid protein [Gottschalkia purinilytica]KNF07161.1 phage putative head morphogenesis protein, SPP1 gp7 family [Gottschalkia purinilytica]
MNNRDYWKKRREQLSNQQFKKIKGLEKKLAREYKKSLKEIEEKIFIFYGRFAKDNKMTYDQAVKQLNSSEYNVWRKSLEEYIKEIESTGDKKVLLELNTLSMKSRISRLEALKGDITKVIFKLFSLEENELTNFLIETGLESYYKTIFEVQKRRRNIGASFTKLSKETVKKVASYPWSGKEFSARIWKHRDHLIDVLKEELTQKIIQGKDVREVSISLSRRMNVSLKNSIGLVQTETAHIHEEMSAKAYEETNVDRYEILATLDTRTSDICRKQDGRVHRLKDRVIGVNYPPFHVNCRTTTVPYFEDDEGTRIAKNKAGKNYHVPASMTYEEWYKEYVK